MLNSVEYLARLYGTVTTPERRREIVKYTDDMARAFRTGEPCPAPPPGGIPWEPPENNEDLREGLDAVKRVTEK